MGQFAAKPGYHIAHIIAAENSLGWWWTLYLFLAVVLIINVPAKDYTVAIRTADAVIASLGLGLMVYLCFLWL
jgi:hypothetical protein